MTKAGVPFGIAFIASGALRFVDRTSCSAFPALRVQKHYLAFVTLAFTVLVWLFLRNEEWLTGGVMGISDIVRPIAVRLSLRPSAPSFYWFVPRRHGADSPSRCGGSALALGPRFHGLAREPDPRRALGVDVRRYTLLAFAIGSAYGGFAGALFAPLVEFIDPRRSRSADRFDLSADGGASAAAATFFGPFIGARSRCCCRNGCASPKAITC